MPGFYGVNSAKWTTRLSVKAEATPNLYQTERYRLPLAALEPGEPFEPTQENGVPSWRMRLKTLLWRPLVGETLRAGPVELGGAAWNDGRGRVARVEVSSDHGASWQGAHLDLPKRPYAWNLWSLTLPFEADELWVRAVDDAGAAQPLEPNADWNPVGYAWSSVERVRLSVR